MRIVAIEGPDGAGKTTLIENLRNNSRRYFVVMRSAAPPPSPKVRAQFGRAVAEVARVMDPCVVICDRYTSISECTYSPIIRGESGPTHDELFDEIRSIDLIVYCRPNTGTILANVARTKQMDGVVQRTLSLIESYDQTMEAISKYKVVLRFDYEQAGDLERVTTAIFGSEK